MARRRLRQLSLFVSQGIQLPSTKRPKMVLPPEQLLAMARVDLRLRERKRDANEDTDYPEDRRRILMARPYSFCSQHVRAAKDVADLLRRAIEGQSLGEYSSGKKQTRDLVYADSEALRAAYEMAIQQ